MSDRLGVRRHREINTCRECRTRKVKCDLARPSCSRCARLHLHCLYADSQPAATSRPSDSGAATVSPTGPSPYQLPGSLPTSSQSFGQGTTLPAHAIHHVSPERLDHIEGRLESLSALVAAMRQTQKRSPSDHQSSQNSTQRKRSRTDLYVPGEEDMADGYLNIQAGGRTKYVGGYYWACICDEASKLQDFLRTQNRYAYPDKSSKDDGTPIPEESPAQSDQMSLPNSMGYDIRDDDAIDMVPVPPSDDVSKPHPTSRFQTRVTIDYSEYPSRPQCDFLLEVFLKNFQSVLPLIHVPSFIDRYQQFWEAGPDGRAEPGMTHAFVSLVCAVLYAGSATGSSSPMDVVFPNTSRTDLCKDLYQKTTNALKRASFARTPAIDSFTAYIIAQSIWYKEEEPLVCCSYIGVAVRIAQMLGLNKDPSHFSHLSAIDAEVRRRVWWILYTQDVLIAQAAGLPPLIDETSWDVRQPSEAKDHLIGTDELREYEAQVAAGQREPMASSSIDDLHDASFTTASGIFNVGRNKLSVITKHILVKLFQQRPLTRGDVNKLRKDMHELRIETFSRIHRIPQPRVMPPRPGTEVPPTLVTYASNGALNKWARMSLAALYAKPWATLYLACRHHSILKIWPDLRSNILYYCRSYVLKGIYFSLDSDFQPFHWAFPGKYQPLHALMVLISEVDRNPNDPSCKWSREVVDEALALCGPNGSGLTYSDGPKLAVRNLTEGGSEAWDFIRALRAHAWAKHGVDPDVMYTRDEVFERALGRARSTREGFIEEDEEHGRLRDASERERGIAILEGRATMIAGASAEPMQQALDDNQPGGTGVGVSGIFSSGTGGPPGERVVHHPGPTPNMNWTEWQTMFAGQHGGNDSFMFGGPDPISSTADVSSI